MTCTHSMEEMRANYVALMADGVEPWIEWPTQAPRHREWWSCFEPICIVNTARSPSAREALLGVNAAGFLDAGASQNGWTPMGGISEGTIRGQAAFSTITACGSITGSDGN
jgi:hypothetical protein